MSDPQTQQTPAQATPNEAEDTPQDEAANTAENEANRLMFENAFTSRFSFSPQERRRMQELLRQKLPISMISTRMGPGGQKLAYLEGHRVIDLANDIFSPFNWSSSVSDLSLDYMERSSGYFCVGVTALVKVTLRDGTYHEDVGFGDARMRSRGDSIKKAKKQAVTDGLKRCLRLFGNGLGNCLLDKAYMARAKKGRFEDDDFTDEQYSNPSLNRLAQTGRPSTTTTKPSAAAAVPSAAAAAPSAASSTTTARRVVNGRPIISSNSMPPALPNHHSSNSAAAASRSNPQQQPSFARITNTNLGQKRPAAAPPVDEPHAKKASFFAPGAQQQQPRPYPTVTDSATSTATAKPTAGASATKGPSASASSGAGDFAFDSDDDEAL